MDLKNAFEIDMSPFFATICGLYGALVLKEWLWEFLPLTLNIYKSPIQTFMCAQLHIFSLGIMYTSMSALDGCAMRSLKCSSMGSRTAQRPRMIVSTSIIAPMTRNSCWSRNIYGEKDSVFSNPLPSAAVRAFPFFWKLLANILSCFSQNFWKFYVWVPTNQKLWGKMVRYIVFANSGFSFAKLAV